MLNLESNEIETVLAKFTVVAAGGCGNVYSSTTNPSVATGDGIAMCHRAKAITENMEFIQFHPTSLYHPAEKPNFLITEAMRGYGAILRLQNGEEFMDKYHPMKSLAPRDVTARAIYTEMTRRGEDFVYLDVRHKDPEQTRRHFPNIYEKCLSLGIDITRDLIPVTPAAHYCCGGVKVDLNGETSIRRLYALGETSCTGLHGANRLASNSLIEAVVYADQAAKHATSRLSSVEIQEGIPDWGFRRHPAHRRDADDHPVQTRDAGHHVQTTSASSARISRSNAPCAACRSSTKRPKSYTTRSSPIASCANCAT